MNSHFLSTYGRYLGHIALIVALMLVLVIAGMYLWRNDSAEHKREEERVLAEIAERAEPIIEAIKRFENETDRSPESLADLIPQYLPSIPGTGNRTWPSFKYRTFNKEEERISFLWYDLGPRGTSDTGLWVYRYGDLDHAVLVFLLDGRGYVREARVDRAPVGIRKIPFDRSRWRDGSVDRIGMAAGLTNYDGLVGISGRQLIDLVGPPTGEETLFDTPWEICVDCSRGATNRNRFLYWPTRLYPTQSWSGRRIGDWYHVVEFF
jgi:hypothetical protein